MVGTILIVALVFRVRYDFKVVVESELEAKEYNEMVYKGKRWVNSGVGSDVKSGHQSLHLASTNPA